MNTKNLFVAIALLTLSLIGTSAVAKTYKFVCPKLSELSIEGQHLKYYTGTLTSGDITLNIKGNKDLSYGKYTAFKGMSYTQKDKEHSNLPHITCMYNTEVNRMTTYYAKNSKAAIDAIKQCYVSSDMSGPAKTYTNCDANSASGCTLYCKD
jgi:hypothetical protein